MEFWELGNEQGRSAEEASSCLGVGSKADVRKHIDCDKKNHRNRFVSDGVSLFFFLNLTLHTRVFYQLDCGKHPLDE